MSRARTLITTVAATLAAAVAAAPPAVAQNAAAMTATERTNKETVRRAFAAWTAGGTRFFEILDDRIVWTILGAGPHAQTYRSKAAFVEAAVTPFGPRLSEPLRPTVRSIDANNNEVITLWEGAAVARDGRPYRNTYAWSFTMRCGRVVEARALLDLAAYDDLLARVPAVTNP